MIYTLLPPIKDLDKVLKINYDGNELLQPIISYSVPELLYFISYDCMTFLTFCLKCNLTENFADSQLNQQQKISSPREKCQLSSPLLILIF